MRIVEWNVGLKKNVFNEVVNVMSLQIPIPDCVILTEVKDDETQLYENALTPFFSVLKISDESNSNYNKIIIAVNKNSEYQLREITIVKNEIHPDWVHFCIYCKDKELNILAVRFQNANLTSEARNSQYESFISYIKKTKSSIDIIIGDFNVDSALTGKGLSWSKVKSDLKAQGYYYCDSSSKGASFSYQRRLDLREKSIGTTPDNVFNKDTTKIWESYYEWDKKGNSDHAMLLICVDNK